MIHLRRNTAQRKLEAFPALLEALRNVVLCAVWDGKPYHIKREMLVTETALDHARAAIARAEGKEG